VVNNSEVISSQIGGNATINNAEITDHCNLSDGITISSTTEPIVRLVHVATDEDVYIKPGISLENK